MDQMLALPVHDQEQEPTDDPAAKTPTVSATLLMLEPPAPMRAETDRPVVAPSIQQARLTLPEPESLQESITLTLPPPVEPAPPAAPLLSDVAAPVPVPLLPLPKITPAHVTPSGLSYRLLTWVNRGFDGVVGWLGWPGRLLASRGGHIALGFVGLAFWTMALLWLLRDWLGW
jgi:hypothetical protein